MSIDEYKADISRLEDVMSSATNELNSVKKSLEEAEFERYNRLCDESNLTVGVCLVVVEKEIDMEYVNKVLINPPTVQISVIKTDFRFFLRRCLLIITGSDEEWTENGHHYKAVTSKSMVLTKPKDCFIVNNDIYSVKTIKGDVFFSDNKDKAVLAMALQLDTNPEFIRLSKKNKKGPIRFYTAIVADAREERDHIIPILREVDGRVRTMTHIAFHKEITVFDVFVNYIRSTGMSSSTNSIERWLGYGNDIEIHIYDRNHEPGDILESDEDVLFIIISSKHDDEVILYGLEEYGIVKKWNTKYIPNSRIPHIESEDSSDDSLSD